MKASRILTTALAGAILLLAAVSCTTPQSEQTLAPITAPTAAPASVSPTNTVEPLAASSPTNTAAPPTTTFAQTPTTAPVPPTGTPKPTNTPELLPTSTPAADPTLAPTVTPTPAPTPTLLPTRTPTPPNPLANVERADRLEPEFANRLRTLPWVADGIDYTERKAAQMLVDSANHYRDTFEALLQKPWVTDGDLTAAETDAIYGIRWTARRDEASALRILDMPFLETLEYDDSLAVLALHRLARYTDDGRFKVLMEHPTLEGGITDDLTTLVAAVGTIREADEVKRMLNPGYANIEVYTGQTELTPELRISIVRPHSEPRPETMPELVRIAELLENTMQVPLPKPHLIFVISDWAVSVSGRGISQGRRYDFAYGLRGDREDTQRFASQYATDRPMLPSVMIHEIGHDYFGNELKSWLNHTPVKTFEYVYRLDGRDPSDVPEAVLNTIHQRSGCEARNIQHLEEMNPPSSDRTNSLCHHYLGYWMGRELLEAVGLTEYFARMRRFYHLKEELVAAGAEPGIAEIRELFPEHLEIVERYWSGDVGNPEEKYWGGLAHLLVDPTEHTFGCCCAGCVPADA